MRFELFIARRLKLKRATDAGSPGMKIALIGIMLAVVVMILSIAVVMGFKNEITEKIYKLDPHIAVSVSPFGHDAQATVNVRDIKSALLKDATLNDRVESVSLIAEKPAILKTDEDYKGVVFRGVDEGYDFTYLKERLIDGRLPKIGDSSAKTEVIISKNVADALKLKKGDGILTYLIDTDKAKSKPRKCNIVGIYSTDFESFDQSILIGSVSLVQEINKWNVDVGNYVGINLTDVDNLDEYAAKLNTLLTQEYVNKDNTLYSVTNTHNNNSSYFSWLSMLDMNVLIILILMIVVSGFTLISAMIMIILERIRMIGTLKALGCDNGKVRRIFIYLTNKLLFKALLWGNAIGLGIALLQQHFHIIKLNAETYYMPYVPIHINVLTIVLLNAGVIVAGYLTMLGPSFIVSTIKPAATMRFE